MRAARGSANGRGAEPSASIVRRLAREPAAAYLPAILTVSWCRPLRRRALSTARPPLVAMRARNPCLLIRLRLRGRYEGFISTPWGACSYALGRRAAKTGNIAAPQTSVNPRAPQPQRQRPFHAEAQRNRENFNSLL